LTDPQNKIHSEIGVDPGPFAAQRPVRIQMTNVVHEFGSARYSQADELPQLAGLPAEQAEAVRELLRERSRLAERYRSVVETTGDAIVITDRRRVIVFANPAAHALFGQPGTTVVGMHVADTLPPEMRETVAAFEDAAFVGTPQRYETVVLRPDGERRIVSVSTAPLREGGEITGVVASLRDITEERLAHDAVRRSEARYEQLVETAADAIFTLDVAGRVSSVNRAFERTVGRSREELVGVRFQDVLDVPQPEAAERVFQGALAGRSERTEIRYRDAEGTTRTGSFMVTPLFDKGVVCGALAVVRDVTEERLLAEQLLQREKLAAVGQLVSGVAHELNNPLAGIMAFAQLLEASQDLSSEHRDAVQTILREAKRAAKIVSNLLLFARQRKPERMLTDLNRVLLDTLELRRYVLHTHQIEVITELDRSLPPVWADPFQLQQVVLNLLTNAEHALKGHAGVRRITIRSARVGDRLVASVSDTGPGIPPEQVDQIFNPFFTTKDVGEGTGLGLSISDGIVRQHGGQLLVRSVVGEGATFSIELPCAPPAVALSGPPEAPLRQATRTFLIVDDEPAIRLALVRYLQKEGHAVDAVATGHEALALVRSRRYDGILLDLRMPDMAGHAVYETLRREDPDHAARVVFATGDVESEGAREFLEAAQRPYVSKPFLLATVAHLLCRVAEG
jgi:two-component system NtrC family sensor kinase